MSTPALKPLPSARSTTTRVAGVASGSRHRVGQLEPLRNGERVDRRTINDDLGDAAIVDTRGNTHSGDLSGHLTSASDSSGYAARHGAHHRLRRQGGARHRRHQGRRPRHRPALRRRRRDRGGVRSQARRRPARATGSSSPPTCATAQAAFDMVDAVVAANGRLDVLVNNAGGSPPLDTATVAPRITERLVQLNLLAAIYCSQQANHHMQTQAEGGAIVNISSVCGSRPSPGTAAYGAAKAGSEQLHEHHGARVGARRCASTRSPPG